MSYFGGAYFDQSPYFNPGTPVTATLGRHVRGRRRNLIDLVDEPQAEDQTPLILLLL
jgi:hypothetical protein